VTALSASALRSAEIELTRTDEVAPGLGVDIAGTVGANVGAGVAVDAGINSTPATRATPANAEAPAIPERRRASVVGLSNQAPAIQRPAVARTMPSVRPVRLSMTSPLWHSRPSGIATSWMTSIAKGKM